MLAHRLFGGLWPALFALAAFALHPRLYAHSFFNTSDTPFTAFFMVCLCLAERAFRRGTAGAFALLGAGVGVLVNLRVMGALLFGAVLGLRALDVALAPGRAARRRALATGAAFAAAAAAALYAVSPHLWADPSRLLEAFALLSQHPFRGATLFAGAVVRWPDIPALYVPTWIAVTTPPALLTLGLAGAAATLGRGLAPLSGAIRAAPPRFGLLLVACPALAVAAVVALNANVTKAGATCISSGGRPACSSPGALGGSPAPAGGRRCGVSWGGWRRPAWSPARRRWRSSTRNSMPTSTCWRTATRLNAWSLGT